jgi:hypothetical protein
MFYSTTMLRMIQSMWLHFIKINNVLIIVKQSSSYIKALSGKILLI